MKCSCSHMTVTCYAALSYIVCCLQECCDIDAVTGEGATALHLAVNQGFASIVELLVGHGIDLFATDGNDCSALHLAMSRGSIVGINDNCPEVEKVSERGLELK